MPLGPSGRHYGPRHSPYMRPSNFPPGRVRVISAICAAVFVLYGSFALWSSGGVYETGSSLDAIQIPKAGSSSPSFLAAESSDANYKRGMRGRSRRPPFARNRENGERPSLGGRAGDWRRSPGEDPGEEEHEPPSSKSGDGVFSEEEPQGEEDSGAVGAADRGGSSGDGIKSGAGNQEDFNINADLLAVEEDDNSGSEEAAEEEGDNAGPGQASGAGGRSEGGEKGEAFGRDDIAEEEGEGAGGSGNESGVAAEEEPAGGDTSGSGGQSGPEEEGDGIAPAEEEAADDSGSGSRWQGERRDDGKEPGDGSKSPNDGSGFDKGESGIVPLKETEKGAKGVREKVFDLANNSGSPPSGGNAKRDADGVVLIAGKSDGEASGSGSVGDGKVRQSGSGEQGSDKSPKEEVDRDADGIVPIAGNNDGGGSGSGSDGTGKARQPRSGEVDVDKSPKEEAKRDEDGVVLISEGSGNDGGGSGSKPSGEDAAAIGDKAMKSDGGKGGGDMTNKKTEVGNRSKAGAGVKKSGDNGKDGSGPKSVGGSGNDAPMEKSDATNPSEAKKPLKDKGSGTVEGLRDQVPPPPGVVKAPGDDFHQKGSDKDNDTKQSRSEVLDNAAADDSNNKVASNDVDEAAKKSLSDTHSAADHKQKVEGTKKSDSKQDEKEEKRSPKKDDISEAKEEVVGVNYKKKGAGDDKKGSGYYVDKENVKKSGEKNKGPNDKKPKEDLQKKKIKDADIIMAKPHKTEEFSLKADAKDSAQTKKELAEKKKAAEKKKTKKVDVTDNRPKEATTKKPKPSLRGRKPKKEEREGGDTREDDAEKPKLTPEENADQITEKRILENMSKGAKETGRGDGHDETVDANVSSEDSLGGSMTGGGTGKEGALRGTEGEGGSGGPEGDEAIGDESKKAYGGAREAGSEVEANGSGSRGGGKGDSKLKSEADKGDRLRWSGKAEKEEGGSKAKILPQ